MARLDCLSQRRASGTFSLCLFFLFTVTRLCETDSTMRFGATRFPVHFSFMALSESESSVSRFGSDSVCCARALDRFRAGAVSIAATPCQECIRTFTGTFLARASREEGPRPQR